MGAGSLMAPLLITVFNVPALSVVGTDLLYSGASKAVTIRGLWDARSLPADGELTSRHRVIAIVIVIGVAFGFVFRPTSVGAGALFGMALILLFPLSSLATVLAVSALKTLGAF
jgi:uncharacterized membrane protein YfcA